MEILGHVERGTAKAILLILVFVAPVLSQVPSKPVPISPDGPTRTRIPEYVWQAAQNATSYEIRLKSLDYKCPCPNADGDTVCNAPGELIAFPGYSPNPLASAEICSADHCRYHFEVPATPTKPGLPWFNQCGDTKARMEWVVRGVNSSGKGPWSDAFLFWYEPNAKAPSPKPASPKPGAFTANCICKFSNGYTNVFFYTQPTGQLPAFGSALTVSAQACEYPDACGLGVGIVGTVKFRFDHSLDNPSAIYKFSMDGPELQ
jgi:hypothetical protein